MNKKFGPDKLILKSFHCPGRQLSPWEAVFTSPGSKRNLDVASGGEILVSHKYLFLMRSQIVSRLIGTGNQTPICLFPPAPTELRVQDHEGFSESEKLSMMIRCLEFAMTGET